MVAVATSAVREADNQGQFLRRVHDEARITVEIVSGMEEARLIHLGAMSAVPIAGRPHIVIDIGGGSTELIVGDHAPAALARSLKLGHIRLTDRFFEGGLIADGAVKACRRHIKSFVAHVAGEARDIGFDVAVGCSGTIAAVAALCAARRGEDAAHRRQRHHRARRPRQSCRRPLVEAHTRRACRCTRPGPRPPAT